MDHLAQAIVQLVFLLELLEGEVHAVTPVVTRISRDIYQLLAWVIAAHHSVGRELVLKG